MATLTEGPRPLAFLLSESNGTRSREVATVDNGADLDAGTVVAMSGGKLIAHNGAFDTNGNVVVAAAGILCYPALAASAEVPAQLYIARDAEVSDALIVWPTESSPGGEHAALVASLKAIGIIVR